MEEDLLFPTGNTPKPRDVRPVIPSEPRGDSLFTAPPPKVPSLPSLVSHVSPSRTPAPLPLKSPRRTPQPLKEAPSSSSSTTGSNVSAVSSHSAGDREPEEIDFEVLLDPRDHSKLKRAWNDMLDKRFLTSGLLAVLPFYVSAEFVDVQIKTALNVPLPGNTVYILTDDELSKSPVLLPARSRSNTLRSMMSVRLDNATESAPSPNANPNEVLAADCASNYRARSRSVTTTSWASMHLAKTMSLLQGCKEAIWNEYSKYGCSFTSKAPLALVREEFLAAWANWEKYVWAILEFPLDHC